MSRSARARILLQAARELGFKRVAWYALYRLGHLSGHYRRVTPLRPLPPVTPDDPPFPRHPHLPDLSALLDADQCQELLARPMRSCRARCACSAAIP
jgi:hypothetical protein